jgi:hypothetical protein
MLLCGTALIMGCALPLGEDFEIGGYARTGGVSKVAAGFTGGGDNSVLSIMAKNKKETSTVEITMAGSGTPEELTRSVNFVYEPDLDDLNAGANYSPRKVLIDGGGGTLQATNVISSSPLITVGGGVELTLQNITFQGSDYRFAPLVDVAAGGKLILDSGAVIRENLNYEDFSAGGVMVAGTLVMTGTATINGNTAPGNHSGGGVYVAPGGNFTLIRGTIAENFLRLGQGIHSAGGVYVASGGKFAMEGGSITENKPYFSSYGYTGFGGSAGVFAAGEFAMKGGEITKNIGGGFSGGVWVESGSSPNDGFTMSGGTITENTSEKFSGGVWIEKGRFTMRGGKISGNKPTVTYNHESRNVHNSGGIFNWETGDSEAIEGEAGVDYSKPDNRKP